MLPMDKPIMVRCPKCGKKHRAMDTDEYFICDYDLSGNAYCEWFKVKDVTREIRETCI